MKRKIKTKKNKNNKLKLILIGILFVFLFSIIVIKYSGMNINAVKQDATDDSSVNINSLKKFYKAFFIEENTPLEPLMNPKDIFSTIMQDYPLPRETTCGDNYVAGVEDCEFPNTMNNGWCAQNSQKCEGGMLYIRDFYGNCNPDCYCAYDSYFSFCSKDECGAECEVNTDCDEGYSCNDKCKCSKELCGNDVFDKDEECEGNGLLMIGENPYCGYFSTCKSCEIKFRIDSYNALGYEICDNLDNDCDAEVDEATDLVSSPCSIYGVCSECSKACVGGVEEECTTKENDCTGLYEFTEMSCDGKDNNCNGVVDEGVLDCCTQGEEEICGYSDKGVCSYGTRICGINGTWGFCEKAFYPEELNEISCDGKDNDCDGDVDENCARQFTSELCNYFDDDMNGEPGSPTSAIYVNGYYTKFGDYCPKGERCHYCDLHPECKNCWDDISSCCPKGKVCGPMFADGVDNNKDAFLLGEDKDNNPDTPAVADGKDNDDDGYVDEGIDEGIDEDLRLSYDYRDWCGD